MLLPTSRAFKASARACSRSVASVFSRTKAKAASLPFPWEVSAVQSRHQLLRRLAAEGLRQSSKGSGAVRNRSGLLLQEGRRFAQAFVGDGVGHARHQLEALEQRRAALTLGDLSLVELADAPPVA